MARTGSVASKGSRQADCAATETNSIGSTPIHNDIIMRASYVTASYSSPPFSSSSRPNIAPLRRERERGCDGRGNGHKKREHLKMHPQKLPQQKPQKYKPQKQQGRVVKQYQRIGGQLHSDEGKSDEEKEYDGNEEDDPEEYRINGDQCHQDCVGYLVSSSEVCSGGSKKLHHLIMYQIWDRAIAYVENLRQNVRTTHSELLKVNEWGFLPLHLACRREAPTTLVKALIEAHPIALEETNSLDDNNSALHYACMNKERDGIADNNWDNAFYLITHNRNESRASQMLVEDFEEGYSVQKRLLLGQNDNGSTPLHFALECSSGIRPPPPGLIFRMVQMAPRMCGFMDIEQQLPLHVALDYKYSFHDVIGDIVKAYPRAVRHKSANGYLPLHLVALRGCTSEETLMLLLQTYPEALYQTTEDGETPLHAIFLIQENSVDAYKEKFGLGSNDLGPGSKAVTMERMVVLMLMHSTFRRHGLGFDNVTFDCPSVANTKHLLGGLRDSSNHSVWEAAIALRDSLKRKEDAHFSSVLNLIGKSMKGRRLPTPESAPAKTWTSRAAASCYDDDGSSEANLSERSFPPRRTFGRNQKDLEACDSFLGEKQTKDEDGPAEYRNVSAEEEKKQPHPPVSLQRRVKRGHKRRKSVNESERNFAVQTSEEHDGESNKKAQRKLDQSRGVEIQESETGAERKAFLAESQNLLSKARKQTDRTSLRPKIGMTSSCHKRSKNANKSECNFGVEKSAEKDGDSNETLQPKLEQSSGGVIQESETSAERKASLAESRNLLSKPRKQADRTSSRPKVEMTSVCHKTSKSANKSECNFGVEKSAEQDGESNKTLQPKHEQSSGDGIQESKTSAERQAARAESRNLLSKEPKQADRTSSSTNVEMTAACHKRRKTGNESECNFGVQKNEEQRGEPRKKSKPKLGKNRRGELGAGEVRKTFLSQSQDLLYKAPKQTRRTALSLKVEMTSACTEGQDPARTCTIKLLKEDNGGSSSRQDADHDHRNVNSGNVHENRCGEGGVGFSYISSVPSMKDADDLVENRRCGHVGGSEPKDDKLPAVAHMKDVVVVDSIGSSSAVLDATTDEDSDELEDKFFQNLEYSISKSRHTSPDKKSHRQDAETGTSKKGSAKEHYKMEAVNTTCRSFEDGDCFAHEGHGKGRVLIGVGEDQVKLTRQYYCHEHERKSCIDFAQGENEGHEPLLPMTTKRCKTSYSRTVMQCKEI